VLVLTPFAWAAAVVNAAFPILAGLALAVPLARSRNRRNYFFVAILLALGVVTFAVHLAHAGRIAWPARLGLQTALDLVLFVIAVMGGRVIPMFTNNGVPGLDARRLPRLEQLALGSVLALLACDVANAPGVVVAVVSVHHFRAALGNKAGGVLDCFFRGCMKAHIRHVEHPKACAASARDGLHHDHALFERYGSGVFLSENRHSAGITYTYYIYAGSFGYDRIGVVIYCHHCNRLFVLLLFHEVRDGNFLLLCHSILLNC
jgi:hypothetical protein